MQELKDLSAFSKRWPTRHFPRARHSDNFSFPQTLRNWIQVVIMDHDLFVGVIQNTVQSNLIQMHAHRYRHILAIMNLLHEQPVHYIGRKRKETEE